MDASLNLQEQFKRDPILIVVGKANPCNRKLIKKYQGGQVTVVNSYTKGALALKKICSIRNIKPVMKQYCLGLIKKDSNNTLPRKTESLLRTA
jgi:hypothetical protein